MSSVSTNSLAMKLTNDVTRRRDMRDMICMEYLLRTSLLSYYLRHFTHYETNSYLHEMYLRMGGLSNHLVVLWVPWP